MREERGSGERKFYLSNLPADATLKQLPAMIKARWICEQAHQQMKEELGLDHFEGRSWTGLHRHALMTMMAYAFLQSRRLAAAGRKKRIACPPPEPSMPAIPAKVVLGEQSKQTMYRLRVPRDNWVCLPIGCGTLNTTTPQGFLLGACLDESGQVIGAGDA